MADYASWIGSENKARFADASLRREYISLAALRKPACNPSLHLSDKDRRFWDTVLSVSSRGKLHLFRVMKAPVIHGQSAPAMFGIHFGKTLAETNITPAVVLLCLNGGGNDRVDSYH